MSAIQKYYGIAYSINPNFSEDIYKTAKGFANLRNFTLDTGELLLTEHSIWMQKGSHFLDDYELGIEYDIFNDRYGRIYGYYTEETLDKFEPITVTLNMYDDRNHTNLVQSIPVTLKLLPTETSTTNSANSPEMFAGKELYNLINSYSKFVYGVYLDDANQLGAVYSTIEENPYTVQSKIYSSISVVGDIVVIFEEFFWIIFLGIAGVSLILLISYAYGNIKKKYYEIGVLKALGATTRNVGFLFSLQTILAGLIICTLSNVALLTLCNPINVVISTKLLEFVANEGLGPLDILQFNIPTVIANTTVILLVTILTCVIPLLKLHRIKPKNIIANKE